VISIVLNPETMKIWRHHRWYFNNNLKDNFCLLINNKLG